VTPRNRKPHLLIVSMQALGGGAEKQSALVAEALKQAFDITLVVLKPVADHWRRAMERKGFKVVALQKRDTFLERRSRDHRLLKVCISLKPDLVYSRWIKLNIALAKGREHGLLTSGLIIQVASTLTKSLASNRLNQFLFGRKIQRYYPKADLIICNGNIARKDLIDEFGVPSDKCVYLPNLLGEDDFHVGFKENTRQGQDTPLRIVCVGRLGPRKDYMTLIKAVARVREKVDLRIEIFGVGPHRKKLERAIASSHLNGMVTLKGFVPKPSKYFRDFDLLVSCSMCEGMSNVMLEAMAAGLPVVVTNVSGSQDVIENSSQGIIFPPGDVDSLSHILQSLATDRQKLALLSREGRSRSADFVVSELSNRYQEVFRSVLATRQ